MPETLDFAAYMKQLQKDKGLEEYRTRGILCTWEQWESPANVKQIRQTKEIGREGARCSVLLVQNEKVKALQVPHSVTQTYITISSYYPWTGGVQTKFVRSEGVT
jgi:hypothetical protein